MHVKRIIFSYDNRIWGNKSTKAKNTVQHTIIQDITRNGKRTTCVYENLGNYDKLKLRAGNENPITWLNNYVKELNKKKKTSQLLFKKIPTKSSIKCTSWI